MYINAVPETFSGEETGDGLHELGSSSFDHQNGKEMDSKFMVTVNNEHIVDGYTPSSEVPLVKLQVEEMKLMELIDAGEVDVQTARTVMGGTFTIQRAVDRSRDGFERRMKQSQYSIEGYVNPPKKGGFLSTLNPFKREPETYPAETRAA